jgi:hypothetical protein
MPKQFKIDPNDLISVVCRLRKETFAFERQLALLTFSLWILAPNDLAFIERGRFLGAAQIVKSILSKRKKRTPKEKLFLTTEFSCERVLAEILSEELRGSFLDDILQKTDDIELAARVASTFFLAPTSRLKTKRPSLNKAIFFMGKGGFGPQFCSSPAAIKKAWVENVVSTPLYLAGDTDFIKKPVITIAGLSPHTSNWINTAGSILHSDVSLIKYFGIARSIQEEFYRLLDPVSRKRFQFIKYPNQISAIKLSKVDFPAEELAIYESYSTAKEP